jgi:hypothetical protein
LYASKISLAFTTIRFSRVKARTNIPPVINKLKPNTFNYGFTQGQFALFI